MVDARRRRGLALVARWAGAVAVGAATVGTAAVGPRSALAATPPRVISIGGGVTEIVYALQAGSVLVATDTTSVFPEQAQATRKVGYQRSLSAEGLLSLAPTLLLASPEAGPAVVIRQVENAGVKVLRFSERHDFEGLVERVTLVGEALQCQQAAAVLSERLRADWAASQRQVQASLEQRGKAAPRIVFILGHAGAPMVAGRDTSADAMIRFAGAQNPLSQAFAGYRSLTPEALVDARPDLILTTTQGLEAQGGIDGLLSRPGLMATPAGRQRRVVGFEALYLLGFGPRMPQAVLDLAKQLGPAGGA